MILTFYMYNENILFDFLQIEREDSNFYDNQEV